MPKVIFIVDDKEIEVNASVGLSILEVAHQNSIPLEGACGGSLACATCHVIVDQSYFDKLTEASDNEEDILDLAFGLSKTSRLGCQIILSDKLDGIKIKLPNVTRNIHL